MGPKAPSSEVLFPEFKLDILHRGFFTRLPDISRGRVGPAEIHAHLGLGTTLQTREVILAQNTLPHADQQSMKIRPAEIGPRVQLSQGIFFRTHGVEHDVLRRVDVDALREIRVNAEELSIRTRARHAQRLRFERRE